MKRFLILLLSVVLTTVAFDGSAQCKKKCAHSKSCNGVKTSQVAKKADVMVYYFHNERRCATCTTVEEVTLKTLKENYSQQMEDGKVAFVSINLEDEAYAKLVEKYKVSGQTLIIVKDEEKVNLTNDAFMYARTKPEKLEAKIKKNIDKLV